MSDSSHSPCETCGAYLWSWERGRHKCHPVWLVYDINNDPDLEEPERVHAIDAESAVSDGAERIDSEGDCLFAEHPDVSVLFYAEREVPVDGCRDGAFVSMTPVIEVNYTAEEDPDIDKMGLNAWQLGAWRSAEEALAKRAEEGDE